MKLKSCGKKKYGKPRNIAKEKVLKIRDTIILANNFLTRIDLLRA